jgi:Sulfotransferase family
LTATIAAIFARPNHLQLYRSKIGRPDLDFNAAVDDFLARSRDSDISPIFLFDEQWFRARFQVEGVNAFVSYLSNPKQRLAPTSPLFYPRWYCRHYGLVPNMQHPLIDYVFSRTERNPHPLLDVQYLKTQSSAWTSDSVAVEYLTNPAHFGVRPHPLFDTDWYFESNPDVAAVGVNPLQHYLYFGNEEGRTPNRFFNLAWYRDVYLSRKRNAQNMRTEPLTDYVSRGHVANRVPGPALSALKKASIKRTPRGPQIYVDAIEKKKNLYAELKHRPDVNMYYENYFSPVLENYNQAFSLYTLFLHPQRIALMYTPKCASAKIVYWWLEKAGLLELAMRFDPWSHAFANRFQRSREFIADALAYDPKKYHTYKFVRDPLVRTVSMFTHFMMDRGTFTASLGPEKSTYSFLEFLHLLRSTDLMQRDDHFRPQITKAESLGRIRPIILKIEDGLEKHFAALEREHAMPPAEFAKNPEIKQILRGHTKQSHATVLLGPSDLLQFGTIPFAKKLLTPETIDQIYDLYRTDFDAYGYEPTL